MLCGRCLQEQEPANFSFKNRAQGKRHSMCKSCHSEYRRQHYLNNRPKYIRKALKWNKRQGDVLTKHLFEILSRSECVDCGEKDVVVLEFDHLEKKKLDISLMYKNRYSVRAIDKELEKCVVRCANCHRRKTAYQARFWRVRLLDET